MEVWVVLEGDAYMIVVSVEVPEYLRIGRIGTELL
jgi:hypothetical protein